MKRFILGTLVLALGITAAAQQPLPVDSAVRVGHLDNGLTYYIRHNEYPKQRAEFHIAQAVGAILEEDNQNGLAHFLEHMAFNGTEHFPGKGIIEYFESIGVNFGGNINAYTSLDETVYRLSDVPTYREGIIDSALLVMHDWACGLSLLPEEIDAERGVIREEWRTGANANRRMWKAINPLKYPGSQYAKRDVIGDTAVINNFAYDALRAYYHKWYGPDNQAIVVVGDIDVDEIEAKIKALWADVPARENRGERPLYSVDDNQEPIVAVVTDKEGQYTRIELDYKKAKLPKELRGTDADYALQVMYNLICTMLNNRFQELAMDPNASFVGAGSYYTELVKEKDAFVAIYVSKADKETQAYKDLLTQMEKMRRYGFTQSELDRAWTELEASYEKQYNERNSVRNITYTREYIRNFLDGEVIPGIVWEYKTLPMLRQMIDLASLNKIAESFITDDNLIVAIQAPEKESVNLPAEQQIRDLLAASKTWEIAAPVEEAVRTTLVEKAPKTGKIKKNTYNEALGTTEWTLSNGVRVILKPTTFKQDEILMSAHSFGGTSTVADVNDLPSAQFATDIVEFCGIGDFSYTDLQKALAGKEVSVSPAIYNYTDEMNGSSTIRDLETMLQLNYLYFTAPRRDEKAFEALKGVMATQLRNKQSEPKYAWGDSIQLMMTDNSPRTVLQDENMLEKVDMDKALAIYRKRFANPSDFIFYFTGNINPEDPAFQKMICTWLGGMKTSKKKDTFVDNNIRVAPGIQKNYFTREMHTRTASNFIQYTSYDIPYTLANRITVNIIGRILDRRYLESVREREGGSYGVGVAGRMSDLPVATTRLMMQFDTDPEMQEKLMGIIHEEVQTIIDNGPLATDLGKDKESLLKDYDEDLEKNGYWLNTILYRYYTYGENYLTDYPKAINAVSAESVQDMLRRIVRSGNMFEVVMLPE